MRKSFENYLAEVDAYMERHFGFCTLDIPDWDYATAWDSNVPIEEAVNSALENSNYY